MAFFAIATTVAVVGAGVSAIGQYDAGQSAKQAADANANLAEHEAQQQLLVTQVQNAVALQGARNQNLLDQEQAQVYTQQAVAVENQAEATVAQSQENQDRQRVANAVALEHQRAGYSASGIVDSTGTPLSTLASSAALMEGKVIDQAYLTNTERTNLLFKASIDKAQAAGTSQAGFFQLQQAGEAANIRGISAQIGADNQIAQAEINRQAGVIAANNATTGAIGSFLGSAGTVGNNLFNPKGPALFGGG